MAVSDGDGNGDGDDGSGSAGGRRVRRSRQSESERERPHGRAGRETGTAGQVGERPAAGTRSARSRVGRLQHSLGNQAVQRLADDGLQRDATTGGGGDRFEREAQRVAEAAVRPGGRSGTDPEAAEPTDSGLCGRCQRRRQAGTSLDCPECLASLQEGAANRDPSDDSEPDGPQRATTDTGGGSTASHPGGSPANGVNASSAPAGSPVVSSAASESGTPTAAGAAGRVETGGADLERTNAESGTEPALGSAGPQASGAGSDPTIGASGGRRLPGSVRATFESRLGYDFGGVRIHTGPRADALARDLDAVAFTVGRDVVFRAGAYQPSTVGGRRLLAHELTHVVQQGESQPLAAGPAAAGRAASPAGSPGSTPAVARREDATVRRVGLGFGFGLGPGELLGNTWLRLGRSMKLRLVDTAIQGALTTIEKFPGKVMLGGLWTFVKPGLRGFYERLQAAEEDAKITAVDKLARIMAGQSFAYAKGLLIGTVKGFFVDGLWGIVEAIEMVISGAAKLWDFLGAVRELVGAFPETVRSLFESARGIAVMLAGNVEPAMQEIENLLTDPQAVAKLVGPIVEAGKSKAAELGRTIAGKLLKFFTKPGAEATVGRLTGRLIGMVLFEVVFAYLTAGAGTAVTAIKTVGRALAKLGGRVVGSVLRVFKLLLPYFDTVVDAVKAAGRFVKGRVLGTVTDQFADLLDTLKDLFNRFIKHCHESTLECDFPDQAASKADEAGAVTSKADEAGAAGKKTDEVEDAGARKADDDTTTGPRTETVPLSEVSPIEVKWIGPKRVEKLRQKGYTSVADLKQLSKAELDDILDASAPTDAIKRRIDEFEPPTRRVDEMSEAEKYLARVKQIHSHHLIPKELLEMEGFAKRLEDLGLGKTSRTADPDPERFLDEQIADIPTKEHEKLHKMKIEGKTYNEWWKDWYEKNPNFTKKELMEKKEELIGKEYFDVPKAYRGGRKYGREKTPRAAKKKREKLGSDD